MNCCFTHQIRENPPPEPKSATGASIDHCSFGHDNFAQHMNDLFFLVFCYLWKFTFRLFEMDFIKRQ